MMNRDGIWLLRTDESKTLKGAGAAINSNRRARNVKIRIYLEPDLSAKFNTTAVNAREDGICLSVTVGIEVGVAE